MACAVWLQICGSDWKDVLRANIDEKYLPKFLGGTCECKGGCVPEVDPDAGYSEEKVKAGSQCLTSNHLIS
jgi:hypothetical protein